jgi:hypothetical protein
MKLSDYERETIINYNERDSMAQIYTCSKRWMNKLDKLCSKSTSIVVENQDEYSKTYLVPKKYIKIQIPRQYSEEQRQKMSDRARNIFARKNI